MKKAFIVVNAYTSSPHELNQPKRLQEELLLLGVQAEIVKNSPALLEREGDFCVYFDKDKYYARLLERKFRLFNRAEAIEICDDKMPTYLALNGLPQPETLSSLLCYSEGKEPSPDLIERAEALGYPVVIKECFGSLGKQVYLAKDREELVSLSKRLQGKPHIYQKFIKESAGRDLRVIVIGGKTVAAMKRSSETDFRSNAELGGKGEAAVPDEEAKTLAEKVAKRLHLDYCGVDLLFGREGYLVCEVNSNAFFGTFEKVTNCNVAAAYARHIVREIYKNGN